MQYTLCLAPGALYSPLSTHASIAEARAALRRYPEKLAAKFRGSENGTGKLLYTTHFAILAGEIKAGKSYDEMDELVVEKWIADRNSAERE